MIKLIAQNKKARFNYQIQETLVAGIVLTGGEVKSLRMGRANINESYVSPENGEIFLINSHILEYAPAAKGFVKQTPTRPRKLLLTSQEIKKWTGAVAKKGQTIIPLELFFNHKGLAKIKIALAMGKNLVDKRETIKQRDWNREKQRVLKNYNH